MHDQRQSQKVVDLFQRTTDRRNFESIKEIEYVMITGPRLKVRLIIDGDVSLSWLTSLRWQITHQQSRRTARVGGANSQPHVRINDRDALGINLYVEPLFPSLGRLEMTDRFRIVLTSPSGLERTFVNRPYTPTALRERTETAKVIELDRFRRD